MSFVQNENWELVELPLGKKIVGYKWVFMMKFKYDGIVDKYKARLVVKGSHKHMELITKRHFHLLLR